jgi:sugar phosphate isomerase/epimerase
MSYPRIHLTVDNCFAIKRWARPSEWMPVIKSLGADCVEASTDNEIDPLFSPAEYMDSWLAEVKAEQERLGMRVANFFTGYQTYRTIGLAHHDERAKRFLMEGWFEKLIPYAAELGAGIGFSFHAFPDRVLQDPALFAAESEKLIRLYGELSATAWGRGRVALSCEQMYAPHQTPWRIEETKKFLAEVYACGKAPFYTTIDVGHMVGQRKFHRPDAAALAAIVDAARTGGANEGVWLGPNEAWAYLAGNAGVQSAEKTVLGLEKIMDRYPHLFAVERDGKPYEWIRELGPYSPIVHMQQTDGVSSGHAAFTPAANGKGIIKGREILEALLAAYDKPADPGMPPRVEDIYLSFEIFISNTSYLRDALAGLKKSVEYWREFIPADGMDLKSLVSRLNGRNM